MQRLLLCITLLSCAALGLAQNQIGIGTTTPADLLHIKGGDLRVEHSGFPKFKLYQGTTEAGVLEFNGLNFWMSNKRPGTIHFRTQEISRLSITNSGNVGIGNFAPEDLLHVKNGDIRLEHASAPTIKLFQGATQAGALRVDGSDLWLDNDLIGDLHLSTQNLARLTLAYGGHVGIGTTAPADLLHVQDGNLRLQGDNVFFDLRSTHPSLPTGIRFYEGSGFRGAMFYSVFTNQLNLTKAVAEEGLVMDFNNNHVGIGTSAPTQVLHVDGKITIGSDTTTAVAGTMRYDAGVFEGFDGTQWTEFGGGDSHWSQISNRIYYNDGAVLVGRTSTIGSERFGVRYPVASAAYGGMYIETNGHADSKPFYGYAIDNLGKMWHYYDGASGDWRINNAGDRFTVENDGDVGIGTTDPDARLHVISGNNWDLANTEGDFKIGNSTHRLVMGLATGGVGAGTARIYAKGGVSKLILGGDDSDVMAVLPNGRVGIGINDPLHALHVYRANSSYNVLFESDNGAPDLVLDHSAATTSNSTVTFQAAGNFKGSIGYDPDDEYLFIYEGGNALIARDGRVGIGIVPNTNYKLSVDGKIIGEEVRVQLSQDWPDYVFEDDYALPTLAEVEAHIARTGHLPGVPSAAEVQEANGIDVGEMNRVLLEKVEELTLYILQQEKRLHEQEERISQLETSRK